MIRAFDIADASCGSILHALKFCSRYAGSPYKRLLQVWVHSGLRNFLILLILYK